MKAVRWKPQNGFSLVEALMAAAAMAFVALGVGAAMSGLFQQQQNIVTRDTGDSFASALLHHLFVNQNCTDTVESVPLPAAGQERDFQVTSFRGYGDGPAVDVQAGAQVGQNIFVRRLFARQKPGAPNQGQIFKVEGTSFRRYIVQVVLQLERRIPGQPVTPLQERVIEVPVLTDMSNIMQSCYTEPTASSLCAVAGGYFDETTGQCIPATQCEVMGTFVKTTCSDPTVPCNPEYQGASRKNQISGGESCPPGSCPTQSGKFTIQRSVQTGKKTWKEITVTENFYICMRCTGLTCPEAPDAAKKAPSNTKK